MDILYNSDFRPVYNTFPTFRALFRLLLLSRRGLHPDRFAHATRQAEPAYTPLRACNPTPRRLGAARVWTLVRIGAFIFPHDLTGQPQCGIHLLEPLKSPIVPECCVVLYVNSAIRRIAIPERRGNTRRSLRYAARRYGARPIVFLYYITDCGHMHGFFV